MIRFFKRGQSSLEFSLLISFALIIVSVLIVVFNNNISDLEQKKEQVLIEQAFNLVLSEIEFAEMSLPVYERTFYLPATLGGQPYTISVQDRQDIVINYLGREYVYFLSNQTRLNGSFSGSSGNHIYKNCTNCDIILNDPDLSPLIPPQLSIVFVYPTPQSSNLAQNFIPINVSVSNHASDNLVVNISLFKSEELINSSIGSSASHFFNFSNLDLGPYKVTATASSGRDFESISRFFTLSDVSDLSFYFVHPTPTNNSVLETNNFIFNISASNNEEIHVKGRVYLYFSETGSQESFDSISNDISFDNVLPFSNSFSRLEPGSYILNATISFNNIEYIIGPRTFNIESSSELLFDFVPPTPLNSSTISDTDSIIFNVSNLSEINSESVEGTVYLFNSSLDIIANTRFSDGFPFVSSFNNLDNGIYFISARLSLDEYESYEVPFRQIKIDIDPNNFNELRFVSPTPASNSDLESSYILANLSFDLNTSSVSNLSIILINREYQLTDIVRASDVTNLFHNFSNLNPGIYELVGRAISTTTFETMKRNINLSRPVPVDSFFSFHYPTTFSGVFEQNFIAINASTSGDVKNIYIFLYLLRDDEFVLVDYVVFENNDYFFVNFSDLRVGSYIYNLSAVSIEGNFFHSDSVSVILESGNSGPAGSS